MHIVNSEIESITKLIIHDFFSIGNLIVSRLENMNYRQFKMFIVDLESMKTKKKLDFEQKCNPIVRYKKGKSSLKTENTQIGGLIHSIVWFFPLDGAILNLLETFPPLEFKSFVAKSELVLVQRRKADRQCEIQELLNLAGLHEVQWTEMFDSNFDQENGPIFCYYVSFTFPGMEFAYSDTIDVCLTVFRTGNGDEWNFNIEIEDFNLTSFLQKSHSFDDLFPLNMELNYLEYEDLEAFLEDNNLNLKCFKTNFSNIVARIFRNKAVEDAVDAFISECERETNSGNVVSLNVAHNIQTSLPSSNFILASR